MESTTFKTNRLLLLLLITGLGAMLVAWQQKQKNPQSPPAPKTSNLDTIPKNKTDKERKIHNLDEALEELDHVNVEIDMEKLNVELAKIGPEVQKEMAKAGKEVAKAIKEIDMTKIKADVDASMANIDWPKIKVDVDESIAKIDWDKMKLELNKVKEIHLDKLNLDMKNIEMELKKIKPELEKNLKNIKVDIEKAKTELREYKSFVDELEKDGLINKKEDYTIKHNNGELIINGKIQPNDTYNKYRSFLEKHKTLVIEKSNDDFNIDND
ncbi:MAG: hypothetical protein JWM28_736 [Chitinophagaceae bacterium]|nr:hypothetical protein [Chitinophagaceae bacterium]